MHGKAGSNKMQGNPRPHQIVFDPSGRWLLVPDKATDRVHVLALDSMNHRIRTVGSIRTKTGSTPRHLTFDDSGTWFATADEFGNSVSVCRFEPATGTGHQIQGVQALADTDVRTAAAPASCSTPTSSTSPTASARTSTPLSSPRTTRSACSESSSTGFCAAPAPAVRPAAGRGSSASPPLMRASWSLTSARTHSIAVHPIGSRDALGRGCIVARTGSPTAVQFLH
jgi:hypothetical protein